MVHWHLLHLRLHLLGRVQMPTHLPHKAVDRFYGAHAAAHCQGQGRENHDMLAGALAGRVWLNGRGANSNDRGANSNDRGANSNDRGANSNRRGANSNRRGASSMGR